MLKNISILLNACEPERTIMVRFLSFSKILMFQINEALQLLVAGTWGKTHHWMMQIPAQIGRLFF